MPPRLHICTPCLHSLPIRNPRLLNLPKHASTTAASAITPAFPPHQAAFVPPVIRHPHNQPPSHRPPEDRKTQLHRRYTSLLRSSPFILFFQHNSLNTTEWLSIRRELTQALREVDAKVMSFPNPSPPLADSIKIQVITTKIFEAALLVVEHFHPTESDAALTHALSSAAHDAVASHKLTHPLHPLFSGPLAVVSFPTISPVHAKAVISILAPHAPLFPPPTRRISPGYYDASTQVGLKKLLLMGARLEGGTVLDAEGVRGVAGIEDGMDGLRARLVGVLGGVGAGITRALETPGRSLYLALEGRVGMLEEGEKGGNR